MFLVLSLGVLFSWQTAGISLSFQEEPETQITCSDEACEGFYRGPEFIKGEDIAHQFSNSMSREVGDHMKDMYARGIYKKVDFSRIKMSTVGMKTGFVIYRLKIPFVRVKSACEAYTSFDHCGGWNHKPALSERKSRLEKVLLPGEKLDISPLKRTREGLQEYWIQWKNNEVQATCSRND